MADMTKHALEEWVKTLKFEGGGGGGSNVQWQQKVSTGTNIATITINGGSQEVYAPAGGGSDVTVTPILDDGVHIADIEVDGTTESIYSTDYSGDISTVDGKVDSVTNRVTTAEGDISNLETAVANNTTTITTHTGQIADIEADVADNTADIATLESTKQNKLTAGANVQINGDTISATDTTYTAGANVQISAGNVISATDTKYTAGDNITITGGAINADLSQYYTSDRVYTKEEINALIGDGFKFIPVNTLPSTGSTSAIYLLRTSDPEIRDMYIYYNGGWVKIGSTGISLTGVVKTTGTKDTYDEHTITVWEAGGVCRRLTILGIGWQEVNTIATNDGYGTNSVGAETGGSKI